MLNSFFLNREKSLQKKLLKNGYIIFDIKDKKRLSKIKTETLKLASKWIKKNLKGNVKSKVSLDHIHKIIPTSKLNKFRLFIFENLNKSSFFHKNYFFLGKEYLDILCGNELVMQKNINLSIQLVNDDSSLLPIHADVYQGDSPYELVLWIPLVNCAKTKSMYILPKKIHDKNLKNFKKYHSTDEIFKKLNKKLKWLKINYGQGLIFTQNILHGNVVNKENTSRWSFNCRFKSLLSPYEGKTIGDFFIPITIRSATKLGMNYVPPKIKK
mgnify:CR=1 FL=1|tara:strand:- start:269 stop:1075 length:807 start_codon:yes stop_codon:yes gene_type:complete